MNSDSYLTCILPIADTIPCSAYASMTREEDLMGAKAQLRYKSPKTTIQYNQAPVEDRRDTLNKMGYG